MSVCPKCGASVSMYDTGGTPWYACESTKTFRSASCVDREPVATQLREAQQRIKRLEEALDKTSKAACKHIKRLESEVYAFRLYGNRDCTAMADQALKEDKL